MRLSLDEQRVLRDFFVSKLPPGARAYLFGSRLDDNARGGDIDVCIVAAADLASSLRRDLHRLRAELRALLGDQRVDVSIVEASVVTTDPFWRQALQRAAPLTGRADNALPVFSSAIDP